MAKESYFVSDKHKPLTSPFLGSIVFGMALDYYNAPQWLWGVVGVFVVCYWMIYLAEGFIMKPKTLDFTKEHGWKIRE
jgi:4-amino-4-deoxy-L-arabinose transferase-like glycosyltransferase